MNILPVLSRLTARDFAILDVLGQHKALTLHQITLIWFGSERAARDRVTALLAMGVLERFRACQRPGSQAFRYTLGTTGAYIHAARTGAPAPTQATITRRITELAASAHLDHLLGVNNFAARLHHHTRHHHDLKVVEWLSEAEATRAAGGMLRPDAAFTLQHTATDGDTRAMKFWFEHDTGTRPLHSLITQIHAYTRLPGPVRRGVLLQLHAPIRENNFHRQYPPHTLLVVATTHQAIATDPTVAIWRTIGHDNRTTLTTLTRL